MYDPRRGGFRKNHTETFNNFRRNNPIAVEDREFGDANMVTIMSDDVNVKLSVLDRKISDLDELFTQRMRPTFDNAEVEMCDTESIKLHRKFPRGFQPCQARSRDH